MIPGEIAIQRKLLVCEALTWIGTPYHPHGRIKGVGADCLTFLVECFERTGLIPHQDLPTYAMQWHLHRAEETYLNGVLAFCDEVAAPPDRAPLPGDIVLWRFGRCFSHGAIVVEWPIVVHAFMRRKIGRADADRDAPLVTIGEGAVDVGKRRPRRFFALKAWA